MKYTWLLIFVMLWSACNDDEPIPTQTQVFTGKIEASKSIYAPNELVEITLFLNNNNFDEVRVTYKYLTTILKEESLTPKGTTTLTWLPPTDDFRGYVIEFQFVNNNEVVDYASTAIDVSSDWTKFPRYGFLSKFSTLSATDIDAVLKNLNQYHINGLQFYDWHNKHHSPLKMNGNTPATTWQDIARRDIYFNTVKNYIETAKNYGMASMSYNLLYGAWDDYASDGVADEWLAYNDPNHQNVNKHDLDDNWALSDIFITDPANADWQNYIFNKTALVYQHLDFDGWHLDQLGDRGTLYKYDGTAFPMRNTYAPFLNNLRANFPNKKMVLNAVNQYGQPQILSTDVAFAYTEVWSPNDKYSDLATIIRNNSAYSNQKNTVLAAYLNYDLADSQGQFNDAGVLMADAVIMAFGGAHLELGEHLLGKEYFPNNNLSISSSLEKRLIEYYDFLVAYQNILRDGGTISSNTGITSADIQIEDWQPTLGKVSTLKRTVGNKTAYHLLNFDGLNSLEWRDKNGTQTTPHKKENFNITLPISQVSKITYVSPDWNDGVQRTLNFTLTGGNCTVSIPYLEYWGMLIVE